jgi:hypothetical protein
VPLPDPSLPGRSLRLLIEIDGWRPPLSIPDHLLFATRQNHQVDLCTFD